MSDILTEMLKVGALIIEGLVVWWLRISLKKRKTMDKDNFISLEEAARREKWAWEKGVSHGIEAIQKQFSEVLSQKVALEQQLECDKNLGQSEQSPTNLSQYLERAEHWLVEKALPLWNHIGCAGCANFPNAKCDSEYKRFVDALYRVVSLRNEMAVPTEEPKRAAWPFEWQMGTDKYDSYCRDCNGKALVYDGHIINYDHKEGCPNGYR